MSYGYASPAVVTAAGGPGYRGDVYAEHRDTNQVPKSLPAWFVHCEGQNAIFRKTSGPPVADALSAAREAAAVEEVFSTWVRVFLKDQLSDLHRSRFRRTVNAGTEGASQAARRHLCW